MEAGSCDTEQWKNGCLKFSFAITEKITFQYILKLKTMIL